MNETNPTVATATSAINETTPDGMIGYIAYHTLCNDYIDPDVFNAELDKHEYFSGWDIHGVSFPRIFKKRCRAITHRYTTGKDNSSHRKIFSLELPEDNDTCAAAIHIGRAEGKRSHSLAQLGVIVLHKDEETVTWTMLGLGRLTDESDEDYLLRVRNVDLPDDGPITEHDLCEVAKVLQETAAHVEMAGGKIDNHTIHWTMSKVLSRPDLHILSLRPHTGGIYFVPNLPDAENNPSDLLRVLGEIVERVGHNTVYLIPQFAEPDTFRAIAASAQETLGGKIADLEADIDELMKIKHPSALASRFNKVRDVIDTAEIYAQLVDLKADDLRTRIETFRSHLVAVAEAKNDEKEAKKEARKTTRTGRRMSNEDLEKLREEIRAEERARIMAELKQTTEDERTVAEHKAETAKDLVLTPTAKDLVLTPFDPITTTVIRKACKDALHNGAGVYGQLTVTMQSDGRYTWKLTNDTQRRCEFAKTQSEVVNGVTRAINLSAS